MYVRQADRRKPLVINFEDQRMHGGQDEALPDTDAKERGAEQEDRRDEKRLCHPVGPVGVVIPEQPVRDDCVNKDGAERREETDLIACCG
jgi:hypothetical protein